MEVYLYEFNRLPPRLPPPAHVPWAARLLSTGGQMFSSAIAGIHSYGDPEEPDNCLSIESSPREGHNLVSQKHCKNIPTTESTNILNEYQSDL